MNDRLKYRVWDKERKCFFNDDEVVIYPNGEESFFNADYDFTESVVEQCTGLKDKNGKLIYEGDIVKDLEGYKGEVSYDELSGRFIIEFVSDISDFLNDNPSELEVIGNIHKNKDLLGEDR